MIVDAPKIAFAVIHRLNPFAVHLVVNFRLGVVEASIALLANQQVGEVHLGDGSHNIQ